MTDAFSFRAQTSKDVTGSVWASKLKKAAAIYYKGAEKVIKTQSFDLHGFTLDEANKEIDHLIRQSYKNGTSKLIIVTGKGLHSEHEKDPYVSKDLGILRYSVPEYIKNNNELMSMIYEIKTADVEDGGSGAFYIFLKKKL